MADENNDNEILLRMIQRLAVVETQLIDHLRSCERKYDRDTNLQLVLIAAMVSVALTNVAELILS